MKKLRLDLEQLEVDSFATDREATRGNGTVRGAQSYETTTNVVGCRTVNAGGDTCGCGATDVNTCDPWNGWCNMSQGGPMHTACDFSCEFSCP